MGGEDDGEERGSSLSFCECVKNGRTEEKQKGQVNKRERGRVQGKKGRKERRLVRSPSLV